MQSKQSKSKLQSLLYYLEGRKGAWEMSLVAALYTSTDTAMKEGASTGETHQKSNIWKN